MEKGAFTFNELPKEIVSIVKNKCLERNAGLYSIIPEFVDGLNIEDEKLKTQVIYIFMVKLLYSNFMIKQHQNQHQVKVQVKN